MDVEGEIIKMIEHQLKIGGLKDGDKAYLKLGGDGTMITKKESATAYTITLSNDHRALQIATVAIVLGCESYQVNKLIICQKHYCSAEMICQA